VRDEGSRRENHFDERHSFAKLTTRWTHGSALALHSLAITAEISTALSAVIVAVERP